MFEIIFCILVFIVAKFLHDNLMLRINIDGLKKENEYLKQKLRERQEKYEKHKIE